MDCTARRHAEAAARRNAAYMARVVDAAGGLDAFFEAFDNHDLDALGAAAAAAT